MLLYEHLEKIDPECENSPKYNKKALKIDGKNGIKLNMNLNGIPSCDYFYFKNRKVYFIEFSNLKAQEDNYLKYGSEKLIKEYFKQFSNNENEKINEAINKSIQKNLKSNIDDTNIREFIKKIIKQELKDKILGTLCIYNDMPNKFKIVNKCFFYKKTKNIIISVCIKKSDIKVLEALQKYMNDLKQELNSLIEDIKLIPHSELLQKI